MTTVVTGASGHVGANLARALLARGRSVRAVVRRDTRGIDGLALERAPGDVLDPESLDAAFLGADVVFHLAASIAIAAESPRSVEAVNVAGTRNVVEACIRRGVRRLVHFSSIHALSAHPTDEPIDETRPLAGREALLYDRTKAEGERRVLDGVARGLDAVIVNPAAVLGRHDYKPSAMGRVLIALARGRMPVIVEGGFDWVDVRDVVDGALAAEERGRCGERYLLTGEWSTVRDLAARVTALAGARPPLVTAPTWVALLAAPVAEAWCRATARPANFTRTSVTILRHHRHIRRDKAERELGYKPRPLDETLRDALEGYRAAGRLDPR